LSLAQTYAALSFNYDHKAEIDAQIANQIRREQEKRIGNEGSLVPRQKDAGGNR
jgi:hypothetical protein